ncbi:BON domain-containing protein [Stieleria sp. TO1_6]|nr:BON domain-containing protein [Stieleria tagensis]
MIPHPAVEDVCRRAQASIQRVVDVQNFSCSVEDGKTIIRGQVRSRDEALMCSVIARLVPGVESVVSEVKVVA